ncbi:MAG: hypothetical protein J5673_03365, partial [Candidatus Methanomethylophilaceae archaeon]|nr:hypothetical protein [Candidatus Methanomethylophilaceae archaeon]
MEDGTIVVCDGMGGAGTSQCTINGEKHTQAYYASRCVSSTVSEYLTKNRMDILDGADDDVFAAQLREEIIKDMYRFAVNNDVEFVDVVGGGIKTMPTTLASMVYRYDNERTEAVCFWAGDSRCYCLDPSKGLIQLTMDDVAQYDMSEPPPSDSPMTNCINLTTDFRINVARIILPPKCILFAVSDGVYGYVPSPMDLEYEFMPDKEDFDLKESIYDRTKKETKDDATIACAIIGMGSLDEYKAQLGDRPVRIRGMIKEIADARCAMEDAASRLSEIKKADMSIPENVAAVKVTRAEYMENSKRLRLTVIEKWKEYAEDYYGKECRTHPYMILPKMEDICSRVSSEDIIAEPTVVDNNAPKRIRPSMPACDTKIFERRYPSIPFSEMIGALERFKESEVGKGFGYGGSENLDDCIKCTV